jgi:hypothetical protein
MLGTDLWEKNMHISQSIRTAKFDKAFAVNGKYTDPQAKHLKGVYKKSLIHSSSMRN